MKTSTEALSTFSEIVYGPADLVEVRCIRGRGKSADKRVFWTKAADLPALGRDLESLNQDGFHIYAGANARAKRSGTGGDVACARCVFVDFDDAGPSIAARAIEAAGIAKPNLLLNSGNGAHAYWRLAVPFASTELEEWASWMRGLIAALNTDSTVKDPPRIMRLPGFQNVKPVADGEPFPYCTIVEYHDEPVAFSEIGVEPLVRPAVPAAETVDFETGSSREPHPITVKFGQLGITGRVNADGTADARRRTAFLAACDLQARGYTTDESIAFLLPGCQRCGLPLDELQEAVENAQKQPREKMEHAGDIDTDWQLRRFAGMGIGEEAEASPVEAPENRETAPVRRLVPNVHEFWPGGVKLDDKGRPKRPVRKVIPLPTLMAHVKTVMGSWPRSYNGILFEYQDAGGELPQRAGLRWLARPDQFTAWLQSRASVYFCEGQGVDEDGNSATPVRRSELFHGLQQWQDESHYCTSVELVPHWPPMAGAYYAPCNLPPATGERLTEFLAAFNPLTEVDRLKILALVLTVFWGGLPGKRPAFIFSSPFGRGAGKTSSAKAIGSLAGGMMTMSEGEDPQVFLQRVFSDDSLGVRVFLLDNLKQRLDSGVLEGWITSTHLSGKRLYVGNARKTNNVVWLATANVPRLSRDLAERSVIINLGEPQHAGRDFDSWVDSWMRENRAGLIADIIDRLQAEPVEAIETSDRWSLWQREILGRIPGGEEVAKAIVAARPKVDVDGHAASDIAMALDMLVEWHNHQPDEVVARVPSGMVANILRWSGFVSGSNHQRRTLDWLRYQIDVDPLRGRLVEDRSRRHGRAWLWHGVNAAPDTPRVRLDGNGTLDELAWRNRWDAASGDLTPRDVSGGIPT